MAIAAGEAPLYSSLDSDRKIVIQLQENGSLSCFLFFFFLFFFFSFPDKRAIEESAEISYSREKQRDSVRTDGRIDDE